MVRNKKPINFIKALTLIWLLEWKSKLLDDPLGIPRRSTENSGN